MLPVEKNAALAEELATMATERDMLASGTNAASTAQAELDTLQARHAVALEVKACSGLWLLCVRARGLMFLCSTRCCPRVQILGEKDEELQASRADLRAAHEDLSDVKEVLREHLSRFGADATVPPTTDEANAGQNVDAT
eukprot:SAG22_NODE_30_length_28348_cov_12.488584_15_plen_140_part_00